MINFNFISMLLQQTVRRTQSLKVILELENTTTYNYTLQRQNAQLQAGAPNTNSRSLGQDTHLAVFTFRGSIMLKLQKGVFSEVFRVSACRWVGSRTLGVLVRRNFVSNNLSTSLNPRKEQSHSQYHVKGRIGTFYQFSLTCSNHCIIDSIRR